MAELVEHRDAAALRGGLRPAGRSLPMVDKGLLNQDNIWLASDPRRVSSTSPPPAENQKPGHRFPEPGTTSHPDFGHYTLLLTESSTAGCRTSLSGRSARRRGSLH